MQIRRIRSQDIPLISALVTTTAGHALAWVAEVAGQVVGYSGVEVISHATETHFWLHGGVQPSWRGRGIGWALLQHNWADLCQNLPPHQTAWVHGWAAAGETPRGRLLQRLGLAPEHVYHELSLPLTVVREQPSLPSDLTIRAWAETDYEAAATLRNHAFALNWGYQPTTGAALRRRFASGRYQAAYSFTAWQLDHMVGLVHGQWQPQQARGEVVWLAVDPRHRRQGLGTALMITVMRAFAEVGARQITLSTDNYADQVQIGLYLRLGFEIKTELIDYKMEIKPENR